MVHIRENRVDYIRLLRFRRVPCGTLGGMSPAQRTPYMLFFRFFLIGLQSFGGGSSTFLLIHEACRRWQWLDDDQFVRSWSLCQLSPGINLIKLSAMIGRRVAGWQGVIAAVSGLVLPSGVITALMTAGYGEIRDHPLVKAALAGILPATVGLSIAMGIQMAQPVLRQARPEGWLRLLASLLIVALSALGMALLNISPLPALLLGGLAGMAVFGLIPLQKVKAEAAR